MDRVLVRRTVRGVLVLSAPLLAALFLGPTSTVAQGLPFHTETALTTAFEQRGLRLISSYRPRDSVSVFVTPLVILPFAPHQRLATRVVVPIVYKRMTTNQPPGDAPYSQAGLGDVSVAVKWAFFVRNRPGGTTRLALVGDVSLPTGGTSARFADGSEAPRPLQLGTGAMGAGTTIVGTIIRRQWGVSADLGTRRYAAADDFRFGGRTRYNIAVGLRVPSNVRTIRTKTLQLYLEWNGTIAGRSRAGGTEIASSGGHVAFLSPGLQWVPHPQLLLEASLQIPVVQDLNGTQLEYGLRPAIGARFLFF